MSEDKLQVDRVQGWDQEKGEYFERVTCPACGAWVTYYEKGDVAVARERDSTCPVCADVFASPVTTDDYGSSWKETGEEGAGGCLVLGFAALSAVVLLVWWLVHLLGTQ